MNLEAGFQFVIFLFLFGFTNYLMMLNRYENDLKKRKIIQKNRITELYPKGTFTVSYTHLTLPTTVFV